ncbi:MAG: SIR2 family protein [Verrucomicrobiota bacterium JB022]|nr:SIR2 family protein [Verrucomicrobiota bacterium JB022]
MSEANPLNSQQPFLRFRTGRNGEWVELQSPPRDDNETERLTQILSGALTTRNLLVLTGSGASRAVGGPGMSDLWKSCSSIANHAEVVKLVNHPRSEGREEDIEHLLSLCLFHSRLHAGDDADGKKVRDFQAQAEKKISRLCREFASTPDTLAPYVQLLRKLVPRRGDFPRTKIFTTNYDLCLENAAEQLGMPYLDGFSFAYPRRFHGRWLDYDLVKRGKDKAGSEFLDGVFQLLKLHGSVDWELHEDTGSVLRNPATKRPHLVYPRDEKFALSYEQPFLEMISRYQSSLREPDTCLVVVGFGFNDHHLVQPIRTALLTNPNSFKMVIADHAIEEKIGAKGWEPWTELSDCQLAGADITFVEGSFANFTQILPSFSEARRQDDLVNRLVQALESGRRIPGERSN